MNSKEELSYALDGFTERANKKDVAGALLDHAVAIKTNFSFFDIERTGQQLA